MKIICVIPARYASTRLPGKPLADIAGKPMIVRVYERVLNATKPAEVIAAVDDERVYEAVVKAGGKAIMTAKNHPTGTDRLAEVAQKCPDADVIINVQGDEPLIDPQIIDDLAQEFLNDENLKMATVKTPMKEEEKAKPGNVKVITDKNGYALYFSHDGFEIAEADLKLRGPGDIEGTQQSGVAFDLKIANLARDGQLLQYVRDVAEHIIDDDPQAVKPENAVVWRHLAEIRKREFNWSAIS